MSKPIKSVQLRSNLVIPLVRYRDALFELTKMDTELSLATSEQIEACEGDLETLKNLESILPINSSACYNTRIAMISAQDQEVSDGS